MKPYYNDDLITLYCGDCIEVMKALPVGAADALVTDPPFAFAGGISNGMASHASEQFFLHWWKDVATEIVASLQENGEGFIWCDWRSAPVFASGFRVDQKYTWRLSQLIYHYREMPGMGKPFRSSVDTIAYIRGPKSTAERIPNTQHNFISEYWYYGKHKFHPAEKSVSIARKLIEWVTDVNDTVLDPFSGGGSTLIAAAESGRKAIGIELEERYCEVIAKRLQQRSLVLSPIGEARPVPEENGPKKG